ncbi:glycosyltransferase family 2 protein [Rosistilla oblonga]|uniref:Putative glycosyltransferase EpsJ n=1 Tax=Rosistilla oblonga TaxID=2527990 RepID=A0A518J1V6_9BACT|nr:glycosyltransferase [Rosistilla oblonga]QDV59320.1 putative glycosyltransferase EpsJ [Rosistilla oblonga]
MPPINTDSNSASLVSVVIPCFNAERWIAESIDGCLVQTHTNTEIIVVDDGSTDGSAAIVQGYDDRVRLIRQPNSGACVARNVGFVASSGAYIQFLDADDYLYPTKIERQLLLMQMRDCDAVYGDWQHQHHEPDGRIWKQEPAVSGRQNDVLESLLGGWWVSPAALLFHRRIVERVGGWDETLAAAQDRDFFTQVALDTNRIEYQPGCDAVYRRYGDVTVSTSSIERYVQNHLAVTQKIEADLGARGRLTEQYKKALARSYFYLARNAAKFNIKFADEIQLNSSRLDITFHPSESMSYNIIYRLFGFRNAERCAAISRKLGI